MTSPEPTDLTLLLRRAEAGHQAALDDVFDRLYDELHRLARRVRGRGEEQTLNTTALVHEAYLKLVPSSSRSYQSREHFFRVAARAMRQILLNAAKARRTRKRGGDMQQVALDPELLGGAHRPAEVIALDEALTRLAAMDPRAAEIVELRFYAGLSVEETAGVLGVSTPTVKRDWRAARAWLLQEIRTE